MKSETRTPKLEATPKFEVRSSAFDFRTSFGPRLSRTITRRRMLALAGGAAVSVACAPARVAAAVYSQPSKRLGIGMHSYGFHWRAAKEKHPKARFTDALEFLQYGRELGAGGVQVAIGDREPAYARAIRGESEKHGLYFEAQFALPKDDGDVARFERDVL